MYHLDSWKEVRLQQANLALFQDAGVGEGERGLHNTFSDNTARIKRVKHGIINHLGVSVKETSP